MARVGVDSIYPTGGLIAQVGQSENRHNKKVIKHYVSIIPQETALNLE